MKTQYALLYMNRFMGEQDWKKAMITAMNRMPASKEQRGVQIGKMIAYCIFNTSPNIKSPLAFFYACGGFDNFSEQDWAVKFKKLAEQDETRKPLRQNLIRRGTIPEENIGFYPQARQAYTDLVAMVEEPTDEYKTKIRSLIRIYGGLSFCITLRKHGREFSDKILWHVGQKYIPYHMERALWELNGWNTLSELKNVDLEEIPRSLLAAAQ